MASYGKFKDFEIINPCYLGDPPNKIIMFDLVKWMYDTSHPHCFTIGELWWNDIESCFEFKSCGLRYLKHREDGLEEWLLKWCEIKEFDILHKTK